LHRFESLNEIVSKIAFFVFRKKSDKSTKKNKNQS